MTALSLTLAFSDYHYNGLDKARYYLGVVVYPIYYLANLPARLGDWTYQALTEYRQLTRENENLKKANLELNSKLQQFSALESQNKRLSELLGSSYNRIDGDAVVARLISTNYTPFRQRIVIDKGKRNNAYVGQPILGARGIVGQIIEITPVSATGMLISDPDHAILAQVNRSGLRVLVVGTGDLHQLRLDYVPVDADVREGDTVVTSGLDDRYPGGYPVGKVTRAIKNAGDNFATITVEPFARLDSHREVLLVWDTAGNETRR